MSRLTDEKRHKVKEIFQKTGSIRATAKQLRVSRPAVRNALESFSRPTPCAPRTSPRKSKLDPYKAKIRFLVNEKKLSGVRVLEEIKELGYAGAISILNDYIRTIRTSPIKPPTGPIPHAPGHEGQMDWNPHCVMMGGREPIVHTGLIALCFSRWFFMEMFPDETIESVIKLHEGFFNELGFVPHTITYDNMTTVGRHVGPGKVWINPVFKRFADQYNFKIIILIPGDKDRHGIVERPFHYIEHNFLAGREFEDLEDLNRRATLWQRTVANVRIHGTLRERPVDRLEREKPYLLPLPYAEKDRYYKEVGRVIHQDFSIIIDTNHYSVSPHLIGRRAKSIGNI